jgi:hypothetical protein
MFDKEFKQMRFIELDKNGTPKTTLDGQELPRKYKTKQAITMAKKNNLSVYSKTCSFQIVSSSSSMSGSGSLSKNFALAEKVL